MIAALFVQRDGPYYGIPDVDPWPEERDARLYAGPWPVVAHPPCARWGKYWHGGPNSARFPRARRKLGDDDGCFAAAVSAVRRFGGVLEHPSDSHAWWEFGIFPPPRFGGWSISLDGVGWTCHVEQGHYGHRARKATWLYAVGASFLPQLRWGPSSAKAKIDDGFHSAEERRNADPGRAAVERLTHYERLATPIEFREVLLSIARSVSQAQSERQRPPR